MAEAVDAAAGVPDLVPAAQYVRMSTEHQQYSTQNQADTIREYAARRGYRIVETYADDGKSGLRIEGRDALKRLIEDVQSDRASFRAILVYDISRWGRFQDSDESAYYEYVCKRAGIRVCYCAEQFDNDGSPVSTIIKSVKRAMAGEYSRELSSKVFQGQCRLIQLGYRQGGPAGYGLRRMLIDAAGEAKSVLKPGEHKSLQTDRVVLVPGPDEELAVVHDIYRRLTADGWPESRIAADLNGRGIAAERGQRWTRAMVHTVLTNEKYIGHNVFNRVSFKLKKKRVRNPEAMWVRGEGAFPAIVDPQDFFIARGILQERARRFTNDELLTMLRGLLVEHGRLSAGLIDGREDLPGSGTFRQRFGSLLEAYRVAGYEPARDYAFLEVTRRLQRVYPQLLNDTVAQLRGVGATVELQPDGERLSINGQYETAIIVTRSRPTAAGSPRWRINLARPDRPDLTVVVRMDPENDTPQDFYLLPTVDLPADELRLRQDNGVALDGYRFESLAYFIEMAVLVKVGAAA